MNELRYASRAIGRTPGFTTVAALKLGPGPAATCANEANLALGVALAQEKLWAP